MRRWKHASRSCGVTKTDYPPALAPRPLRSVKAVGADEVVLDREQEGLVLRELDEAGLRRRVEVPVERDLDHEARSAPRLRERGHPEEDPPGLLVLRDRLELLEVVEPQGVHEFPTPPGAGGLRRVFVRTD